MEEVVPAINIEQHQRLRALRQRTKQSMHIQQNRAWCANTAAVRGDR
jgi:hypothetical protein